ncbi:hypothetical protein KUTeg_013058 [Tegillarca granosa]|uniref:Uncharacterized protein n=1 Tax=Tegillarca granosa TaxID=220873 RepID=A0ABQ9ESK6_TEGGR|nr:hypothetical protein KUTeg_013058 [Tegillarca granosa]
MSKWNNPYLKYLNEFGLKNPDCLVTQCRKMVCYLSFVIVNVSEQFKKVHFCVKSIYINRSYICNVEIKYNNDCKLCGSEEKVIVTRLIKFLNEKRLLSDNFGSEKDEIGEVSDIKDDDPVGLIFISNF